MLRFTFYRIISDHVSLLYNLSEIVDQAVKL